LPYLDACGIIGAVYALTTRLRRRWRAALQTGSLILLLAFLPTSAYVGHWGEFTDYAFGRTGHERSAGQTDHASHCHGVSSCSEQPQPIGVRVLPSVFKLPRPAFVSFAAQNDVYLYNEIFISPPTEPPRL